MLAWPIHNWYNLSMFLQLLLLPFRIVFAIFKLAIKIILLPLKMVGGCLFPIIVFLIIIAVLAYFIYQWVT